MKVPPLDSSSDASRRSGCGAAIKKSSCYIVENSIRDDLTLINWRKSWTTRAGFVDRQPSRYVPLLKEERSATIALGFSQSRWDSIIMSDIICPTVFLGIVFTARRRG